MPDTSLDTSTVAFATFGEMLKYLRRRARLTQQEFGIAVGYSESYITRLEGNSRPPVPSVVRSLFIDALDLHDEPLLAKRLIALADATRFAPRRTNLVAHLTHFIGRMCELADVDRLVMAHRLVTLTGSGGVGKTRLAQEAAAGMLDRFADGVWLVEFASLADAAHVPLTVAATLRLPNAPTTAPIEALCAHLADKQALLLLDNCEHLVQSCAELADNLLRSCPQLHILATSREALQVPGEVIWRVPPMASGECVQLFADRASAAKPDFVLDSHTAVVVASIGQRLDGIPLAIELAASRVSALSVEQLASRLGDRFRLLTDGSRTALPRHQTLRALIDWSHDLLSDQERLLFRRLAVFSGGWTADAAEQVCATPHSGQREMPVLFAPNVLPMLLHLVSKSLIVVDERGAETRYHLLETIREYAWEQLAAGDEVGAFRQQHARYFLDCVRAHAPRVMRESGSPIQLALGVDSDPWVKKLEQEYGNLRAALEWCLREAHDPETGVQLVLWMYGYWEVCGPHTEAIQWLECALAQIDPSAHTQTRAQLLTALANSASVVGDYARAEAASIESLALCRRLDNRIDLMRALIMRTSEVMNRGYYAEAQVFAEEWLALARDLHNARYEGIALSWLGIIVMHRRDLSRAAELHEESLRVTPANEHGTKVMTHYFQAMVWWCQGDNERALARCNEALDYFRETGWELGSATVLHTMGDIVLFQGDEDRARHYYLESLRLLHRQGTRQRIVWPLAGLAALAAVEGQAVRAVTLWAAADALRASVHSVDLTMSHDRYLARIEVARAGLEARIVAAAEADGGAMSFDQAVAYASVD